MLTTLADIANKPGLVVRLNNIHTTHRFMILSTSQAMPHRVPVANLNTGQLIFAHEGTPAVSVDVEG